MVHVSSAKAVTVFATVTVLFLVANSWRAERASTVILDGFQVRGAEDLDEAVLESIRKQIGLVNGLAVSEETKAFFQRQTIWIDRAAVHAGHSSRRGVTLKAAVYPEDKPVLLHELLHMYHFRKLHNGVENPFVAKAFETARSSGAWPAGSYMLSNRREFFAMTASAVLYGQVARPPWSREDVARHMPAYYEWLKEVFELTLAPEQLATAAPSGHRPPLAAAEASPRLQS